MASFCAMEQGTPALEQGAKTADVPRGEEASLRVAMVPHSDCLNSLSTFVSFRVKL